MTKHLAYADFITTLKNAFKIFKPGSTFRGADLKAAVMSYVENFDKQETPKNELMRNTMPGVKSSQKSMPGKIKNFDGNSKHLWMWTISPSHLN